MKTAFNKYLYIGFVILGIYQAHQVCLHFDQSKILVKQEVEEVVS